MKSKYYWLMGLSGVMSVVLVSGLANANWRHTLISNNTNTQTGTQTGAETQKQTQHIQKHRHGFKPLFRAIDSNQDKQISLEEVHDMLKMRFSNLDDDADGLISLQEFSTRHLSLFDTVDKNNDGIITRDEIHQHRKERHAKKKHHS
jgi:Ca2+-binding EF-hand superfamily protein